MSYIRSTSNPEKLYIWSNVDSKNVTIMMGSETLGDVPKSVFNGLIKKCVEKGFDECKYNGASISVDETEFKVRFKYKDIDFLMYSVTWYYITVSNYKSIKKQEEFFKKRNRNI
ncbi:MAG: hypothetical protein ACOC22_01625 [bacterium]